MNTHGLVNRANAIGNLQAFIKEAEEAVKKCEADFARPWFEKKFKFWKMRREETRHEWSPYAYEYYAHNTMEDVMRMRSLLALACNCEELYMSPEDYKFVQGKYRKVKNYRALPFGAYYKESKE